MDADDRLLEEAAEKISQGDAVDWKRLASASQSVDEMRLLENLRVVDELGRHVRGEGEASVASVAPTAGAAAVSGHALPRHDDLPQEQWGSLNLLEKMGEGSFGEVYRAFDPQLQRQVALKLLTRGSAEDERWQKQILKEGRLVARVRHPHVVTIHGVENRDGRLGIWMEFIEGTTLHDLVQESGPLGAREAALVGQDLCAALAAVHGAGVLHRDVKAQNVMKEKGGRIVLMDFGAGEVRRDDAQRAGVSGTPLYLAPELFAGESASPRSDIYGVGVLLYYLVTGEYPVRAGSLSEMQDAHAAGKSTRLRDARPDLPAEFVTAVEGALAADLEQRIATAGELDAALGRFLGTASAASLKMSVDRATPAPRNWLRVAAPMLVGTLILAFVLIRAFSPSTPLSGQIDFTGYRDGAMRGFAMGDVITSQDQLELSVELTREAYVYVLNLDGAGRATVMFPMAGDGPRNPLTPGRTHLLPGEVGGKALGWRFGDTEGVERFLVVASTERLEEFEKELDDYPVVAVGGGLTVQTAPDDVWAQLTRGVVGVGEIQRPSAPGAGPAEALFDLARSLAEEGGASGKIWLHQMSLMNPGTP